MAGRVGVSLSFVQYSALELLRKILELSLRQEFPTKSFMVTGRTIRCHYSLGLPGSYPWSRDPGLE